MVWYSIGGQLSDVSPEDMQNWSAETRAAATPVPSYATPAGEQYQWDPQLIGREGYQAPPSDIRSGSYLLGLLDKQASGQPLSLADQSKWEEVWRNTIQGAPTRDWRTMALPGTPQYYESEKPQFPGIGDPDYYPIIQQVHRAAQQGDQQARDMLGEIRKAQERATYQAVFKQDAFSPFGDQFFGALGILGLAGSAGAAAPLFAGGAGLGTTLGSLGALAGTAGQGLGVLGEALDVPGLRKAGSYLGAAGGLAGGVGGLANLWGTGINSLGDAARLASSAGRIAGGLGTLTDSDVLRRAGGYLGTAGQLGSAVNTLGTVFGSGGGGGGGGGGGLSDASGLASGIGQAAGVLNRVQGLLGASGEAQRRGAPRPAPPVSQTAMPGMRVQRQGLQGPGPMPVPRTMNDQDWFGRGVQGLLGAAGQAQQRGLQGQSVPRTMNDHDWLGRPEWQPGPWQQYMARRPVLANL